MEIGAVLVTVGEERLPHLLLKTPKVIYIGLQPLTPDQLEASIADLQTKGQGAMAAGWRSEPGEVRWLISEENFGFREPGKGDDDLLKNADASLQGVVDQVHNQGLESWSTWRTAHAKQTKDLRRQFAAKGLIFDESGDLEIEVTSS